MSTIEAAPTGNRHSRLPGARFARNSASCYVFHSRNRLIRKEVTNVGKRDYPDRTLTEFDQASEAISLDGVHRPAPPTTSDGSGDDPSTTVPGVPSPGDPPPSPPSGPPSTPPPCQNLLGLLCPTGSR